MIESAVAWWQVLLGALVAINLTAWALSAGVVFRSPAHLHSGLDTTSVLQLSLCAIYVGGCAFRSLLPVYDIPRICLVESPLSSVAVGRSVATVAELGFAAQWALMVHHLALLGHSPFAQFVSLLILPLIVLAEVCSWYAVLTTKQRWHAAENSLWGLTAVLVVVGLLVIGTDRLADLRAQMIVWSVGGGLYAAFIFFLDVPMYWTRGRADELRGHRHFSPAEGLVDVCRRRVVSYRWEDWKDEIAWMSLYFSFGVWSSISLVTAAAQLSGHG